MIAFEGDTGAISSDAHLLADALDDAYRSQMGSIKAAKMVPMEIRWQYSIIRHQAHSIRCHKQFERASVIENNYQLANAITTSKLDAHGAPARLEHWIDEEFRWDHTKTTDLFDELTDKPMQQEPDPMPIESPDVSQQSNFSNPTNIAAALSAALSSVTSSIQAQQTIPTTAPSASIHHQQSSSIDAADDAAQDAVDAAGDDDAADQEADQAAANAEEVSPVDSRQEPGDDDDEDDEDDDDDEEDGDIIELLQAHILSKLAKPPFDPDPDPDPPPHHAAPSQQPATAVGSPPVTATEHDAFAPLTPISEQSIVSSMSQRASNFTFSSVGTPAAGISIIADQRGWPVFAHPLSFDPSPPGSSPAVTTQLPTDAKSESDDDDL